jgi:hypothetical protein
LLVIVPRNNSFSTIISGDLANAGGAASHFLFIYFLTMYARGLRCVRAGSAVFHNDKQNSTKLKKKNLKNNGNYTREIEIFEH